MKQRTKLIRRKAWLYDVPVESVVLNFPTLIKIFLSSVFSKGKIGLTELATSYVVRDYECKLCKK